MRSKRLPGLAVFTLDTGDQIGRVRRPVIDPKEKQVAALLVSARGSLSKRLLPIDAVFAMGSHAITVQNKEALRPVKGEAHLSALALKDRVDLLGSPVITARGELMGIVKDFEVSERGAISTLYVSGGLWKSLAGREVQVPGDLLIALGKDATVVSDDALERVVRRPPHDSMLPQGSEGRGLEAAKSMGRRFGLFVAKRSPETATPKAPEPAPDPGSEDEG